MNERIKAIREYFGLNQRDFSKKINIGQSTLAMFETGDRIPKDIHISMICGEFNVSEKWLRTGNGNMFLTVLEEDELAGYCAEICMGKSKLLESCIMEYMKLDASEQEVVEKLFKSISKRMVGDSNNE